MSVPAATLPAPSSRWIVSRPFDLAWFFGGAGLSVGAALLVVGAGASIVTVWWIWLLAFDGPQFAIEKRFGVSLRDGELDVLSGLDFSSPEVMRDGFLTREVVARLTPALPALREVEDPERVTPAAVFGLVTVAALGAMVERRLGARR